MPDGRQTSDERAFAEGILRAEAAAVTGVLRHLGEPFHQAVDLIETCANAGGTVLVT